MVYSGIENEYEEWFASLIVGDCGRGARDWSGICGRSVDDAPEYKLAATYKIGGEGGWDYATLHHGLLYVTRVTHTMAIDVSTGRVVADIYGQKRSHGVALVPDVRRGFISDGGSGSVLIFDLKSHAVLGKVPAADDADGIIYDRASNRVLVMCGDAHKLVAIAPDVNPNGGNRPRASIWAARRSSRSPTRTARSTSISRTRTRLRLSIRRR